MKNTIRLFISLVALAASVVFSDAAEPKYSAVKGWSGNRSRPVEEFGGGLLVEAGFDGGTEPLVDGPFLQAAGF